MPTPPRPIDGAGSSFYSVFQSIRHTASKFAPGIFGNYEVSFYRESGIENIVNIRNSSDLKQNFKKEKQEQSKNLVTIANIFGTNDHSIEDIKFHIEYQIKRIVVLISKIENRSTDALYGRYVDHSWNFSTCRKTISQIWVR